MSSFLDKLLKIINILTFNEILIKNMKTKIHFYFYLLIELLKN